MRAPPPPGRASLFKYAKRTCDIRFKLANEDQLGNSAFIDSELPPTLRHAQAHPPAHLYACAVDRKHPRETEVKRRGLRNGPARYAAVRREGGRDRASAQLVPVLEHKQEWGRDEAAVGPRAARGGERGDQPDQT